MAGLTEKIRDIDKRVGALETRDLDEASGIARIVKIYGNVKITATITTRVNTALTPSSSLYPDDDLYNEIYPIG